MGGEGEGKEKGSIRSKEKDREERGMLLATQTIEMVTCVHLGCCCSCCTGISKLFRFLHLYVAFPSLEIKVNLSELARARAYVHTCMALFAMCTEAATEMPSSSLVTMDQITRLCTRHEQLLVEKRST